MKEHQIIELGEDDEIEIRTRKKFNFDKMAEILLKGNTFFLPGVDRRSAAYVRRTLEKMLDDFIEITHGYRTSPNGEKEEGYVFEFGIAKQYYGEVYPEEKAEDKLFREKK